MSVNSQTEPNENEQTLPYPKRKDALAAHRINITTSGLTSLWNDEHPIGE